MWTHRHNETKTARAIRIAVVLAVVFSLGMLCLHLHADHGETLCPQCVLLAGLVLPVLALILSVPALLAGAAIDAGIVAPSSHLAWSRRLVRGPPSAR